MKIESLASTIIHWSVLENPALSQYLNEHKVEMAALLSLFYNFDTLAVVYSESIEPYGKTREYIEKRLHDYQQAFEGALDVRTENGVRLSCDIEDVLTFIRRYKLLIENLTPDATGIDPRLLAAEEEIRRNARQIFELKSILRTMPEAPGGIVDECAQPPAAPRPNKAAPAVGPPLLNFTDAMRRDIEILQGSGIIKGNGSARPNFKDKRDAVALFDLWDDYYDIYGEYPNAKVIQESVMVKGREFRDVASVRSRNASAIEQRKLEILSLLPHLKK